MRIMYFSSGRREAVLARLLADRVDIGGVYVTDPIRWPKVAATIALARSEGLPVTILSRANLQEPPEELRGAVCLSVGFGLILPSAFLNHVAVCLNVHGTLLPDFPGARSLNWVIASGQTMSGVTVHVVDNGIDTGPIVLQRDFPLSPFETGASLARKTLELEPEVVSDALALFEAQGLAAVRVQERSGAQSFPDRTPEHSRIDPRRPLLELIDEIRAADPERYPAFFEYAGAKVCIRLWRPKKPDNEHDLI
jgi:methionyl-tRNA formyltransferase